ncbi:MAG: hypothetical protein A2V67_13200 [Deltaproteobacteria bacterium RBG_13_61_14]|nr:MAG: hypothetical protein A2V67_13200 [Deltaproteobacteria bacterium RBG_13_61_14]
MKTEPPTAKRDRLESRLVAWLIQERERLGLSARSASEVAVVWKGMRVQRCKTAIIFDGPRRDPALVVKLSRGPLTDDLLEAEAQNLQQLASLPIPSRIPKLLARMDLEGIQVLVREYVSGIPWDSILDHSKPSQRVTLTAQLVEKMTSLLGGVEVCPEAEMEADAAEVVRQRLLEYQGSSRPESLEQEAIRRALAVVSGARGLLPWVKWQNGDLVLSNLLSLPEGGLALIDWEHARSPGLPLVDAIIFAINLEWYFSSLQFPSEILDRLIQGMIAQVRRSIGLGPDEASALSVYTFMDILLRENKGQRDDPLLRNLRSNFQAFLRRERFRGLPWG